MLLPPPRLVAVVAVALGLAGNGAARAMAGEPAASPDLPTPLALPPPTGEASGLVLGLRNGNSYRTLYLDQGEDGSVTLTADLPFIVTPQRDGFWVLGAETVVQGPGCPGPDCNYLLTDVWVDRTIPDRDAFRRDLARELASHFENDPQFPTTSYYSERRIEFVANGVVCLHLTQDGYAAGTAHPFAEDELHCLRMPPNRGWDRALPLPLADAMVPAARVAELGRRLQERAADGHFEQGDVDRSDLEVVSGFDFNTPLFRLGRERGQTMLTAIAYGEAPYVLSNTYSVSVTVSGGPAPPALTPYNPDIGQLFDRLHTNDPAVQDVFVAPTHGVVYVITGDRLIALDPATGHERLALSAPHDTVVVAEWALGANAQRWRDAIGNLRR